MKNVYVLLGCNEYECNYLFAFTDKEAAEKLKDKIEEYEKTRPPFPTQITDTKKSKKEKDQDFWKALDLWYNNHPLKNKCPGLGHYYYVAEIPLIED